MSIPYLVHKEDAAAYDAIRDAMEPLRKEYRAAESAIFSNSEDIHAELNILSKKYDRLFVALNAELEAKYGKPRVICGLNPRPKDTENYYTYYRGHCWDKDASNSEMLGTIPDWARQKP